MRLVRQAEMRALGNRRAQFREQFRSVNCAIELGAHVEALGGAVHEFLVANDIDTPAKQDPGDSMDQSRTIRTLD